MKGYPISEQWRWGNCGDNIRAGQKFARRFLRARGNYEDARRRVDDHNNRVGIKV